MTSLKNMSTNLVGSLALLAPLTALVVGGCSTKDQVNSVTPPTLSQSKLKLLGEHYGVSGLEAVQQLEKNVKVFNTRTHSNVGLDVTPDGQKIIFKDPAKALDLAIAKSFETGSNNWRIEIKPSAETFVGHFRGVQPGLGRMRATIDTSAP